MVAFNDCAVHWMSFSLGRYSQVGRYFTTWLGLNMLSCSVNMMTHRWGLFWPAHNDLVGCSLESTEGSPWLQCTIQTEPKTFDKENDFLTFCKEEMQ